MLDDLGLTWDEFGQDYAGLSRRHADNLRSVRRRLLPSLRNRQRLCPPAPARTSASVIELQIRVDGLAADLSRAIAALHPELPNEADRAALSGLSVYAVNKFRNFARQLGAAA